MQHDSVITTEEFEAAREKSDEVWSDMDVFDEERSRAPLREIVLEVVEGQYTHPTGPDTSYGMEGSAQELVWDEVFSSGLVPEGIPEPVRKQFARSLGEEVSETASDLYDSVRDEIDEDDSLEDVRAVIEPRAEELVPETY